MAELYGKKIYCVVPAFNEEKHIVKVLRELKRYVKKIILVDDASNDNTAFLAEKEGVIVLRHLLNRDQGAALETGDQYALAHGAEIIVHFDADGQFKAEEINDLIRPLVDEKYDVVLGSRFLDKHSYIPWLKRFIIFPLARIVNFVFFGIRLSDPQSGFRAMTRKAAAKIKIRQDGKAHCSEILHKIYKNKLRVKEVPISVIYNNFGQTMSGGWRIVKDILIGKLLK